MGLFKKKEPVVEEIIPEVSGKERGLEVTIKNMTCHREVLTSKLKLPDGDFACNLSEELLAGKKVVYEDVKETLQRGDRFIVNFFVQTFPEMTLEIRGTLPTSKKQFYSDSLDAIIDAWKSNGIHT
jgi:hypothetical protein